jgi:hypothetical protein
LADFVVWLSLCQRGGRNPPHPFGSVFGIGFTQGLTGAGEDCAGHDHAYADVYSLADFYRRALASLTLVCLTANDFPDSIF